MDINQIKIQLATAKANAKKGDIAGSLKRFIYALHALIQNNSPIPTELKSLIRETAIEYNSFAKLKEELKISFSYVAGEEKELLRVSMKTYEYLTKDNSQKETYEEALKRKKAMDGHLIAAKDFINKGFIEQTDIEVNKALEFYKDETSIFAYIGQLYFDKNYITRAKYYYNKAAEAEPTNQAVVKKLIEINKMQQK